MVASGITFTWFDYLLFFAVLGCSVLIGIYFGWCVNKQSSENNYFLGGKTMGVFPVAVSLIASNSSSVMLVGITADVYKYGAMFIWCLPSLAAVVLTCMYISMPVLATLESCSVFEYLELRFNRSIRMLSSLFGIVQMLLFNSMIIYVPSLCFAQVTGYSTSIIIAVSSSICIFYTAVGGFRAVVWTDTLQTFIMYLSLGVVASMGVIASGGFTSIWMEAHNGDRLDVFKFNFDITSRDNFSTIFIGFYLLGTLYVTIGQSTIQRLMAVPSISQAKIALFILFTGLTLFYLCIIVTGLIVYERYSKCDPVSAKKVHNYDSILLYYFVEVAGKIVGFPGLFVAGLFSAGLSSVSTNLNSLAAVMYSDFLQSCVSSAYKNLILKLIVIISGAFCLLLTFSIQHFGGIIPASAAFLSVTGGALVGVFTLGLTVPRSNATGALWGGIAGVLFTTWIVIGNYVYTQKGVLKEMTKSMSTEKCNITINTADLISNADDSIDKPFLLYRINYWYFMFLGCCVTVVVGFVVSLICHNKDDVRVRKELIAPPFRFLLPYKETCQNIQHYSSLEKSLNSLPT